jgi:hypothetical protein
MLISPATLIGDMRLIAGPLQTSALIYQKPDAER